MRVGNDTLDARAETQFHVFFVIEFERLEVEALRFQFAGEVLLRKRRTLVWRVALLAHEHDFPFVAALAERSGRLAGGVSCACDDYPVRHGV